MVQKARRLDVTRAARRRGPQGHVTRGTTAAHRMRRVDRWLLDVHGPRLRAAEGPDGTAACPLVIDLGFGARPTTAVELHTRVRSVAPGAQTLGLEIDPERVAHARQSAPAAPGLDWAVGGFEVPAPRPPTVIRAFNVLRQYREEDVATVWAMLSSRLAPGGVVVEGTCSENGRRAAWVQLDAGGPVSLTIAVHFGDVDHPSDVAARLPKALIHRNVPGERVHEFLSAADSAWALHGPLAAYGKRQRWIAMAQSLKDAGWPVLGRVHQWRRGELSVAWSAVAPGAGSSADQRR